MLELLPDDPADYHRAVLLFARKLKAIPGLAEGSSQTLLPYLQSWFEKTKCHWPKGSTFADFRSRFEAIWPCVKYVAGTGPLDEAWERAKENVPAIALELYDDVRVQLLVSLCAELQRVYGKDPFFLGCRSAADKLSEGRRKADRVHFSTVARWFTMLCNDGILRRVKIGAKTGKGEAEASEYFYLPEKASAFRRAPPQPDAEL